MWTKEENERFTRVGPGTPAGHLLRCYWWPIELADEVKVGNQPRAVRVLGEDLALFRDQRGRLGLLGLHCSHRGTSLAYGRVEDDGIRCPYHGWLYANNGRCLDQPAEPEDSTYKDRIQHPAYAVEEMGGLIWAYLGPQPAPLLPQYDVMVREGGRRFAGARINYCNWLQIAENTADQSHLSILHGPGSPRQMKRPFLRYEKSPFGIRVESSWDGISAPRISHNVFPSHNRITGEVYRGGLPVHTMFFRTPVDDGHTAIFNVNYLPHAGPDDPVDMTQLRVGWRKSEARVYARVDDGWWGIPMWDQDRMAVETQGEVYDRTTEHLVATDRGVILLRELLEDAMRAVEAGRDPLGVLRDVEENEYLTFDASTAGIPVLV